MLVCHDTYIYMYLWKSVFDIILILDHKKGLASGDGVGVAVPSLWHVQYTRGCCRDCACADDVEVEVRRECSTHVKCCLRSRGIRRGVRTVVRPVAWGQKFSDLDLSPVQGTRRPQRIRLFPRALVLDRSWFPDFVIEEYMLLYALSHICAYEKGDASFKEFGPFFFVSGGFGADFTQNSMLTTYRPDLLHLPTTNGEHCTGDVIKMDEAIGAKFIDLEWMQVHPTGLLKPYDPVAKIKFLASEALRGVDDLLVWSERETRSCLLDWWAVGPHCWANYLCLRLISFFSSWLDLRVTTFLQGPTLSLQMVEPECVSEAQKSRSNLVDCPPCEWSCFQCVILSSLVDLKSKIRFT